MKADKFLIDKPVNSLVTGRYCNARIAGSVFSLWTPYIDITIKDARQRLLFFANGDGEFNAYEKSDIESVWFSRKQSSSD